MEVYRVFLNPFHVFLPIKYNEFRDALGVFEKQKYHACCPNAKKFGL